MNAKHMLYSSGLYLTANSCLVFQASASEANRISNITTREAMDMLWVSSGNLYKQYDKLDNLEKWKLRQPYSTIRSVFLEKL